MTVDGVEFLRRFLLHVLPTSFVRTCHFGLRANRNCFKKLARCWEVLAADPTTAKASTPSAPAAPKAGG